MNKSAILHIPLSQYAFAEDGNVLTIRLRTAKNDLTECLLFYGDRACRKSPVEFKKVLMERFAWDDEFDYYEAVFKSPYERVCYYFLLRKEEEETLYYADSFHDGLADLVIDDKLVEGRSEYYQYPFMLRGECLDVPKWFKNSVVYNIFPDSFADGRRSISCKGQSLPNGELDISRSRLGGTLRGIIENLDYISNLGFDCIYLNPIFVAGEWHKYDTLDVWENSETWLRGDVFDSTMNYDFRKNCRDFFALECKNSHEFIGEIQKMLLRYPRNISLGQLNLLDSHDVPRFFSLCNCNRDRFKLALITLLLFPGVPSVLYGDELGMKGVSELEYRSPMAWERAEDELASFIKKLISIRKKYISPDAPLIIPETENVGLFSFPRMSADNKITVYMNTLGSKVEVNLCNDAEVLLEANCSERVLQKYGFLIVLNKRKELIYKVIIKNVHKILNKNVHML